MIPTMTTCPIVGVQMLSTVPCRRLLDVAGWGDSLIALKKKLLPKYGWPVLIFPVIKGQFGVPLTIYCVQPWDSRG